METDFSDSGVPATRADIALVLTAVERGRLEQQSELRAFRVWVEGKFELVEQKFDAVGQRFGNLEQRIEALEQRLGKVEDRLEEFGGLPGWRLTVLNVTLVAAIIGAGVLS